MRFSLVSRLALLGIVVAVIGLVVAFGRRLGLSELLIVGLIVALLLLAEGTRVVVAGIIKGYRSRG